MLKRVGHIILSVWFSLLLLFGTTAKEFIHLFTGHEDTTHQHSTDGFSFETQHHHCTFLSFFLSTFHNDVHVPVIKNRIVGHAATYVTTTVSLITKDATHTSLRGPPANAIV